MTESTEAFARAWQAHATAEADAVLDDLAAQGAAGDSQAGATLVEIVRRHRLAHPALRKVLIAEADIDDAEQTTLIAVATGLTGFEGRAKFRTWLHTVALNEARMLIRARDRRPAVPLDEVAGIDGPQASAFMHRVSSLIADRAVIDAAIADLTPEFRETLLLRERDGLDYDEIAARLALPVGTVRSRLHRARAALGAAVRGAM